MTKHVLSRLRLDALIDALTEALAGEIDGNRKHYEGALDWAVARRERLYNGREKT